MNNSSNTTSTNLVPIVTPAGVTLVERYVQFAAYFAFGFISLIGNAVMALGIAINKEMRSRFYVIIVYLLLCRCLMCLQMLFLGTYRFLNVVGLVGNQTRLVCALFAIFIYPGTLELLLLLTLAIDRAIALFAVAYYRRLNFKQAMRMCTVVSVVPLIVKVGLLFGDTPLTVTVSCFSIFDAIPPAYSNLSQNFDLVLLILLLVVYIAMLVALRLRLWQLEKSPDSQTALLGIKRHMVVMPTVRNIVVVHCAWTLSAKVLLTLALEPFAAMISAKLLLYAGFFVTSELLVNVVILFCTNKEVRTATYYVIFPSRKISPNSSGGKAPSGSVQQVQVTVGQTVHVLPDRKN